MDRLLFLSSPEVWARGHGPTHPLKPERLQRTYELLEAYGALGAEGVNVVAPRRASPEELTLFHTREYIQAVEALSKSEYQGSGARFGFGPGDNPVFPGMYHSEGLKVGSALQGAQAVESGQCRVAFSYIGGLHHAGPAHASGFCVFNDAAVAIQWLVDRGLRVAYVDVDVHHGDGVQEAFYDTDRVLTISLHQDGRTLFPGTGFLRERGRGAGEGYAVNLPMPPGVDNALYLWAFDRVVPPLLDRFQPDITVTQLGVDTHYQDPLARLELTTRGHERIFQRLEALTDRWLALGGGGYNLEVVPRSWTLAFATMAGLELPDKLPPVYRQRYGGECLHDVGGPSPGHPDRAQVRSILESTVQRLREINQL